MQHWRRQRVAVWGVFLVCLLLAACGGGGDSGSIAGDAALATGPTTTAELAPTQTPSPFKEELVICASDAPDRLYGSADPVAEAILRTVSMPAAVYGESYMAEPGLLASLPNSSDGSLRRNDDGTLTIVLHYRDDLVWSDGQPFSVDDALLGLSLPASPYAPSFGVLDAWGSDMGIEATVTEGAAYPYVPSQPPLPTHVLGDQVDVDVLVGDADAQLLNPSLGPYFLQEVQSDGSLLFASNPHYTGADLRIPAVHFRFIGDPAQILAELTSGGCDVVLDDNLSFDQLPDLLAAQQGGKVRAYAWPGTVWDQLVFNTYAADSSRVLYFADVRVRQAVAYAFDRTTLAQATWDSISPVLDSWLPPDHWAYVHDGLTSYSVDRAVAANLLDEAGWIDQDGDGTREYHSAGGAYTCQRGEWRIAEGTPFSPELLMAADDPLRVQIAQQLQNDLAQLGIHVQVRASDPDVLFASDGPVVRRDFDMIVLAGLTRPDPGGINQWVGVDVFRHPLEQTVVHRWDLAERWLISEQLVERLALSNIPGSASDYQGQNYSGWCDEQANIAIVEANLAQDLAERQAFYAQHQVIFTQQAPLVPLFARPRLAASASYVCGILPGPYDPLTWNIAAWYFDEKGLCQ